MIKKTINFIRIDKDLPTPVKKDSNAGIDLYAREEMMIQPSFAITEQQAMIENKSKIFVPGDKNLPMGRTTVTLPIPGVVYPPTMIPLNVIIKGEEGFVYFLFARSSLFKKKGLMLANNVGVVDPSYQGINDEIKAAVINFTPRPIPIKKGEFLCQLVIMEQIKFCFKELPEHWGTDSRGGFGSTGGYNEN